jgi:uncharacterized protein YbjT (DUF2867 family)
MARCLIIGCGCRGRSLAVELLARGHVVRGTTRSAGPVSEIEATGAEAVIADPDRVATIAPALAQVAVVCVLLGSARGGPSQLAALHTDRLEMLLTRIVDTPVRGLLYEASGTVDPSLLSAGAAAVSAFCGRSRIPFGLLEADPRAWEAWVTAAADAVELVLSGGA